MTAPLRVGIIGAGAVVEALHAPGYTACPDAALVAITSRTRTRAERVAGRFGIPTVYPSAADLLAAADIDAVSICTPPHTHRELVEGAAAADKHVLVEKPAAHTLDDVVAIRDLADSADVVIELVRNERFMELHQAAQRIVRSGELGRVVSLIFFTSTTGPDDWTGGSDWPKRAEQAGGGVLLDLGVHKADLVPWLVGQPIVDVTPAVVREPRGEAEGEVEWAGAFALTLADGAAVTVSASWLGPPDAMLMIVAGSNGLIEANGASGLLTITRPDGVSQSQHVAPWSDADESHLAMVADFVAACLETRRLDDFARDTWDSGTRWVLESYRRRLTRPA